MGKSSHIKYFEYKEFFGGFSIAPIYKEFDNAYIEGSWGVLPARIFGVHYVDWLHYCEAHGARLMGKNWYYVIPYWKEPNQDFLNVLNERTNELASLIDLKRLEY